MKVIPTLKAYAHALTVVGIYNGNWDPLFSSMNNIALTHQYNMKQGTTKLFREQGINAVQKELQQLQHD